MDICSNTKMIILIMIIKMHFYSHCQAYKKNCSQTQGHEAAYLDKTTEFIGMTSKIVNLFDDRRPVSSLDDHRLATNHKVLDYLNRWEKDAEGLTELSKAERAERLLSDKLRCDLSSMIIDQLDQLCLSFPFTSITQLNAMLY